jgi:branched-chain amino acid transport system permease protein
MPAEQVIQSLVIGALLGSLYGLAALGLSLIFGVMKVLNVAQGELLMFGGYASFWIFNLLKVDPFVSLVLVLPLMFVVGAVLHFGLFSQVVKFDEEHRIKNSLLIGFGLTLVFQTLAIQWFTADDRRIALSYAAAAWEAGGIRLPLVRFSGLVIGIIVVIVLQLFLRRTTWGRAIRATAEDWQTASLSGIDVQRVYLVTFGIGAALAGLAGMLVSVNYSISPAIGLHWTLKALIVVVLAGLGSMPGTFLAGILLGLAEATTPILFPDYGAYREMVGLVLFFIILSLRPQGLFGEKHA